MNPTAGIDAPVLRMYWIFRFENQRHSFLLAKFVVFGRTRPAANLEVALANKNEGGGGRGDEAWHGRG